MKKEIGRIVKTGSKGTLTKIGQASCLSRVSKVLKHDLNIQIRSFEFLKITHVEQLIQHFKSSQCSRSLQNTMAHIRSALRGVDRETFAADPRISNKSLGINGASRDGTHRAISLKKIEERISKQEPGAAATSRLQLTIGLRAREAVQASPSLKSWAIELQKYDSITVVHGAKNGRTRIVRFITPESKQAALEAIKTALEASLQAKEVLIPSKTLSGAMKAHNLKMAEVGFLGEESSHALRCTWAQEQYSRYLVRLDGDVKESLSRLSMDLGHGDGRGRYVKQVYLKNSAVDD